MNVAAARTAIALVSLLATAPASAAVFWQTITGSLLPGIDEAGILGTPGAELDGLPFTYSLYFNGEDYVNESGDYFAPTFAASGQVGGLVIPFHAVPGGISGWQTPQGPFFFSVSDPAYPGVQAEFYDPAFPDFVPFTVINFFAPTSAGGAQFASGALVSYTNANIIIPDPIPEPSTWLLLLVGFGATGAVLRSRRAAAKVTYT